MRTVGLIERKPGTKKTIGSGRKSGGGKNAEN